MQREINQGRSTPAIAQANDKPIHLGDSKGKRVGKQRKTIVKS